MANLVKKIRTSSGDLQIDYESLANLPITDTTLAVSGQAADAKAVGDAFDEMSVSLDNMSTKFSNPNLLINSDFRNPVNQRGQTSYTGGDARVYTIDRWCLAATDWERTVEVCDGYIRYSNPNAEYQSFWLQHFERALPNENYTISVNVKNVAGDVWVGNLIKDDSTGTAWGNSTQFKLQEGINIFTFTGEVAGLYFQASISSNVELYWVKLECGKLSTQFSPRLWSEELALCRRHFDVICGVRAIGVEHNTSTNTITYSIPRTAQMAGPATVTIRGSTAINSTDGICVRDNGCSILPMSKFEYEARSWEVVVTAYASGAVNRDSYATQIYVNDAFLICLDAEIY